MNGRAGQRRKVVSPRRRCEAGISRLRQSPTCHWSPIFGTDRSVHNHKPWRNSNKRSGDRYRTGAFFGACRFLGARSFIARSAWTYDMSSRGTLMAEPQRDHGDIDSSLEQVRDIVTKAMRAHPTAHEFRTLFARCFGRQLQALGERNATQLGTRRVRKERTSAGTGTPATNFASAPRCWATKAHCDLFDLSHASARRDG